MFCQSWVFSTKNRIPLEMRREDPLLKTIDCDVTLKVLKSTPISLPILIYLISSFKYMFEIEIGSILISRRFNDRWCSDFISQKFRSRKYLFDAWFWSSLFYSEWQKMAQIDEDKTSHHSISSKIQIIQSRREFLSNEIENELSFVR